jgi:hypothetical protein
MNRLIATIIAIHVLVHSIFGCCDHAFAALSSVAIHDGCSHAAARDVQSCGHKHSHHDEVVAHDNEDEPCKAKRIAGHNSAPNQQHDCRHASCYWQTQNGFLGFSLLELHGYAALAPQAPAAIASKTSAGISTENDVGRYHALPLRLHLAVGVLLI